MDSFLSSSKRSSVRPEMLLYRLQLECKAFENDAQREDPATRDKYVIAIVKLSRSILEIPETLRKPVHYDAVLNTLDACGLAALAGSPPAVMEDHPAVLKGKKAGAAKAKRSLSFEYRLLSSREVRECSTFMHVKEDPVEFQLRVHIQTHMVVFSTNA